MVTTNAPHRSRDRAGCPSGVPTFGSRASVFKDLACMTSGGLRKKDLAYSESSKKYVSKHLSQQAKSKWVNSAVMVKDPKTGKLKYKFGLAGHLAATVDPEGKAALGLGRAGATRRKTATKKKPAAKKKATTKKRTTRKRA